MTGWLKRPERSEGRDGSMGPRLRTPASPGSSAPTSASPQPTDRSGTAYVGRNLFTGSPGSGQYQPLRQFGAEENGSKFGNKYMPGSGAANFAMGSDLGLGSGSTGRQRGPLKAFNVEMSSKANLRKEAANSPGYEGHDFGRSQTFGMGNGLGVGAGGEIGGSPGSRGLFRYLLRHFYLSWMFVFIPIGFFAYHVNMGPLPIFVLNFLAIVPQAWLMGKATEDCAEAAGHIIGGLLNAWFGNIVEMLLCIAGIRQGELMIVRCTLIGSVLSNLLLVSGCALLAGGLKYKVQEFSAIGASSIASLLMVGAFCAGLPTIYSKLALNGDEDALRMSRVIAFVLIALYLQYMIFQLSTHTFIFQDHSELPALKTNPGFVDAGNPNPSRIAASIKADSFVGGSGMMAGSGMMPGSGLGQGSGYRQGFQSMAGTEGNAGTNIKYDNDDDDEEEEAAVDMSAAVAAAVLGVCTVLCSFNSEYLISSISGVVNSWTLSKEFIGIILLPIIGNAAEHYTSVVVAINNKMDLSLGCAIGSSAQMLLFVTPMTVLFGWILGQPVSLDLHAFEILVLILSIQIISNILQDGYSNWLEGSILLSAYFVISVVYFFEDPRLSDLI